MRLMKKFVAGKAAFIEIEEVVRENSRVTGQPHAVHIIVPPVVNDDGDFLATELMLLNDDCIAFKYVKKCGNPEVAEIRSLGKGCQFLAEAHPHDFATNFLRNC